MRKLSFVFFLIFTVSCGGGGSETPTYSSQQDNNTLTDTSSSTQSTSSSSNNIYEKVTENHENKNWYAGSAYFSYQMSQGIPGAWMSSVGTNAFYPVNDEFTQSGSNLTYNFEGTTVSGYLMESLGSVKLTASYSDHLVLSKSIKAVLTYDQTGTELSSIITNESSKYKNFDVSVDYANHTYIDSSNDLISLRSLSSQYHEDKSIEFVSGINAKFQFDLGIVDSSLRSDGVMRVSSTYGSKTLPNDYPSSTRKYYFDNFLVLCCDGDKEIFSVGKGTLTVDFVSYEVTGSFQSYLTMYESEYFNEVIPANSEYDGLNGDTSFSFTLTNGRIRGYSDGRKEFTATLSQDGDVYGSIEGSFYGANAKEIGAVINLVDSYSSMLRGSSTTKFAVGNGFLLGK